MASEWWEEFKNLFKTDNQIEQERQQKINEVLNAEKEVADKLADLEKQYNDTLTKVEMPDVDSIFPQTEKRKEIEYNPQSDEDIVAIAEREIGANKTASKNNIESQYEKAVASLNDNKESAKNNLDDSYENLSKLYAELKEKANNDSLRRGMARSSVATNRIDALDKEHMSSAGEAEKAYLNTIAKIDSSLADLAKERENALGELDLTSASELDKKISDLKNERDAKIKEYEEYNATVRKENEKADKARQENIDNYIAKWKEEQKTAEEERIAYENKYGYSGEKQRNYSERYNLAYDFYSSLSPDIAVDALKASPNMKYYLGNYYSKLLTALKSKAYSGNNNSYY